MKVFDLFCGCGGASTGLVGAAAQVGQRVEDLVAVNHWDKAVETHRRNHPWATVLHEDVSRVDPLAHLKPGTVQLGLAGPSCTQHSRAPRLPLQHRRLRARRGRTRRQLRAAWHRLRHPRCSRRPLR